MRSAYRARLKAQTFAAYGGQCACCGEAETAFLSIDHIGGWRREHSQAVGKDMVGEQLYRWLRDHDYPTDRFRVLCFNCNFSTRADKVCPHTVRSSPSTLVRLRHHITTLKERLYERLHL